MLLQILREEFKLRQWRNCKYSLRAFSRALKLHSSTLSAILNEKRKISPLQAQKILRELGIDGNERKAILLKMINEKPDPPPSTVYKELDDDVFSVISGWEHFALLSCLDLYTEGKSLDQLATKMRMTEEKVLNALLRLEKFNLVKRQGPLWSATGLCFTTTHDVPSEALQLNHREYILKALISMHQNTLEERDVTGITMAISSKKLPVAKKMIANFRREMAEYLEDGVKDEVYRLNIQLFPLTK